MHSVKKTWLLALCMLGSLWLSAQTNSFRFFPIDSMSLTYQGFVGNIGTRFFLLNKANRNALDLNVYDTVTRTNVNHTYHVSRMEIVSVVMHEQSISFIGVSDIIPHKLLYHFFEVNEKGELMNKSQDTISVINTPLRAITSNDRKHVLFFQYARKNADSVFIQGSMIGAKGQLEKELSYSFKDDRERAAEPEAFVDNKGNTHVLVYDKFNNYRLSTELTINSIYFKEEEIISESFTLEKLKLRTMNVFHNQQKNCLQIEGLYADGSEKNTRGVYAIRMPLERKGVLVPKFFPFTSEMIKEFKKGYSMTDVNLQNNLSVKQWNYTDSGSLIALNLNQETVARMGGEAPPRRDARSNTWNSTLQGQPSMLITRSKAWNAPKQIFLKVGAEQGVEWYYVQRLDYFRPAPVNYNNVYLLNSDIENVSMVLYQSDRAEMPHPAFISLKNGKPVTEKFPERELAFSPIQYLRNNQFGSLYMNMETGEAGILVVHAKD